MIHVGPKSDDAAELLPHALVLPNGLAAAFDERFDAVLFDLILAVDADRLFDLELDGQPVSVPAGFAEDFASLHRPIAREHIFDDARQDVPDMRLTVGGRRAVVESIIGAAVAPVDRLLLNVVVAPKIFDFLLARGEVKVGIDFFIQNDHLGRKMTVAV